MPRCLFQAALECLLRNPFWMFSPPLLTFLALNPLLARLPQVEKALILLTQSYLQISLKPLLILQIQSYLLVMTEVSVDLPGLDSRLPSLPAL